MPRLFDQIRWHATADQRCATPDAVLVWLEYSSFPLSVGHHYGRNVRVKRQFLGEYSPFAFPCEIDSVRRFVAYVSILVVIVQQCEFGIRLVDHGPPAAIKEPSLVDHDTKRHVSHSMCHRIGEDSAQLTDRRFAEAHTSKSTLDAAGSTKQSFFFNNRRKDLRCVIVGLTARQMDKLVAEIISYHVSPCVDGPRIGSPGAWRSKIIRIPLRLTQQPIRLFVADDLLFFAVEDQLAAQHVGEVSQDAEGGRAMGDFYVYVG